MSNTSTQTKPKTAVKPKRTIDKAQKIARELYPLAIEGNELKTINNVIATKWQDKKIYVYVLYKARRIFAHWDKILMYVGITNNPARRIWQHNESKRGLFTHVAIIYCGSDKLRGAVAHAEALIIAATKPLLNIKYNPDRDEKYIDPKTITHFVENQ